MSAPCRNALDCPCLHIQHCPSHHSRINLGNLSGDIGLQLVEGGWARAVDLGLQEAPEAEVQGGEVGGARRPLSEVPIISLVSLVSEKEFDENGRYGMHSTTGFLASHGFVKKVILDFSSMTAIFAEARFR